MALTVTWDETSPDGNQARNLGDDRIREFKKQVREVQAYEHVAEDGTAITSTNLNGARHKLSAMGLLGLLKGLRIEQRSHNTIGNITIFGRLQIEINGDICSLASDISLAFSGLLASTSYYIYASSPGHKGTLATGNFTFDTTVPIYSTSKMGWYNGATGTSRAIGFFRTDMYSNLLPFVQTDKQYSYVNDADFTIDTGNKNYTSYTEVTDLANYTPVFIGIFAKLSLILVSDGNANTYVYFSTNGSRDNFKVGIVETSTSTLYLYNVAECCLSATRTIYYKVSSATDYLTLSLIGFDLDGSL